MLTRILLCTDICAARKRRRTVFQPLATKTYGLMALVKGKRPPVNRGPENTVMSWPHLFWAELSVLMVTVATTLDPSFGRNLSDCQRQTSQKPTSGQWKDSHSGEGVFL